jgi:hypothetical protein
VQTFPVGANFSVGANFALKTGLRASIVKSLQFSSFWRNPIASLKIKTSFIKLAPDEWVGQVRSLIVQSGHTELLSLMHKLDRAYNETEEELYDVIRFVAVTLVAVTLVRCVYQGHV